MLSNRPDHPFLAHSANTAGQVHPLREHLQAVAALAAEFATPFGAADEAARAGMLHDLGKYGDRFQRRLRGLEHGIDHWSAGAWAALTAITPPSLATALAIQGHHLGLQQMAKAALSALRLETLAGRHPQGLLPSETALDVLHERFAADGGQLPAAGQLLYPSLQTTAAAMLDVRMLFSTLVDADFLDTATHFLAASTETPTAHPAGPALHPKRALTVLLDAIECLSRTSQAAAPVNALRADLLHACLDAGTRPVGLWTLTAPTGAGKTLAMLAFALRHAAEHGLRRIVLVIPYLSIIEQTAAVYRAILAPEFGAHYLLEQHSLAGTHRDEQETDDGTARLLAQNWDAPLILTTSVQALESLFANRPAACRKLHRLADSVLLFDEVQTLPTPLIVPTLATLARLSERYRTSVVFSTATQPAFSHLHDLVRAQGGAGWHPAEITTPNLHLFSRARRTKVDWPDLNTCTTWHALAEALAGHQQAVCVVNLKRHAWTLLDALRAGSGTVDDVLNRLEEIRRCWQRHQSGGAAGCRRACALGCAQLLVLPSQCVLQAAAIREPAWWTVGRFDGRQVNVDTAQLLAQVDRRRNRLVACCPQFDRRAVETAIAALPAVITPDESPWQLVFHRDDGQPAWVWPVGTPLPPRLTERGVPTAASMPDRARDHGITFGREHDQTSMPILQRTIPPARYTDVCGQDAAIAAVREVIELPVQHAAYFTALGAPPQPGGVLLAGPPGTGKTLLARAVAAECGIHLEVIAGPEILSQWVGGSEQALREVFARAQQAAPSLILIDELDSIAPARSRADAQHQQSLVAQLLVLLDGLDARRGIAVLATTNRPQAIDPALRRPGRFDRVVWMRPPDVQGRAAILRHHLASLRLAETVDREAVSAAIAAQTDGASGADLAYFCQSAARRCVRDAVQRGVPAEAVVITDAHLQQSLQIWLDEHAARHPARSAAPPHATARG